MTHTPRPYQNEARYQVNTLLNASRHPVYVAPTGTGKTKTAVTIIQDQVSIGNRIYILTPQVEIFDGWLSDLINSGIDFGTISEGRILGASKPVYLCMPMTLVNLLSYIPEPIYPDIIITDECHHSSANTWEMIYSFFPYAIRFGLTATPKRTDGKGLDHLYTDIIQTITMKEAINHDPPFLSTPLVIAPEMYLDLLKDVEIVNGEYDLSAQAEALGKTQIIGNVIENYSKVFGGLPVLVACSTFEHAKDMTAQFNDAGWRFAHIHSGLHKRDRRRMLKQIANGKLNGLCTVGIGIEGMDIPGLHGLIWLRRTMSLTIYLQFIGRVLRIMKGKTHGIILDMVGNLFLHGFPEKDRMWTLEGSDARQSEPDPERTIMQICPFCGVANAGDNIICHFCGEDLRGEEARQLKSRKLPSIVDGELVVVKSDGQIEEIKRHIERVKENIKEAIQQEEKKRVEQEAVIITMDDKKRMIRNGLFGDRKMFKEAVRNYL